jgi:hypothetical protein
MSNNNKNHKQKPLVRVFKPLLASIELVLRPERCVVRSPLWRLRVVMREIDSQLYCTLSPL